MKLSKQQIEHIAMLARVGLTDEEKEKFATQISSILDYVEKLNEVDTNNIEPISQITGLKNVSRPDEIDLFGDEKRLVEVAPESDDNLIKTKSVFE